MRPKFEYLFICLSFLLNSIISIEINQTILFRKYGHSFNSEFINLTDQNIDSINVDTFKGLNKLEILYLEKNNLRYLDSSLFKDLVNLKEIWLENNRIVSVDKNIFEGLTNLEIVCLKNNPISDAFPTFIQQLCKYTSKCTVQIAKNCVKKPIKGNS